MRTVVKGCGSGVRKRKNTRKLSHEETIEKKKAILVALTKASEDHISSRGNPEPSNSEADDYYTLSRDEMEALVNGDMERIESWVSNMDRNHATRLLRWLIKERW
jgi:hypothetical protein